MSLEIERSIIKRFRNTIYKQFVRAIDEYELIHNNDKVMVCISGGKDSFLLAKCIQEYQKHGRTSFEAIYVCMDPGYNLINREKIELNSKLMNIPLEIIESDVFDVVDKVDKNPCYLCARMRRGFLYRIANEKGCNKICLGHHFDDVIETTLLNMFYGSEIGTMLPKRQSDSYSNIEVIRPLYKVKEEEILKWVKYNNLSFINCACNMSEESSDSKRREMKELIKELKEKNPLIDEHIFASMHNVNLKKVIKYKE